METAYDKIMNKGLKRGIQQGIQQGSQEATLSMTLSLLDKKFGTIDSQTEARVKRLSTDKLKELGIALFDFRAWDDLTIWLDENTDDLSLN